MSKSCGVINVTSLLQIKYKNKRCLYIFFNNNFEFKVHQERKDKAGNLIALDLTIEGNMVTLINIYGPNTDSPEFYEYVREIFLELDNDFLYKLEILILP